MTSPETSTQPNRLTPLQALCLVAAPAVAIAARLLWTPIDDEDSAAYLTALAEHPDRSDVGTFLMILSALLLVPATFALVAIVRDRSARTARIATAMVVTGAFAMTVICALALTATNMAEQPDRARMVDLWDNIYNDPKGQIVFLGIITGVVGFVVLAVVLYRSKRVPRTAAVLVGLGGAATLITSGGPVRALIVTAAALALTGFGWIAASTVGRSSSPPRSQIGPGGHASPDRERPTAIRRDDGVPESASITSAPRSV
jgi:hypothetical protein